MPAPTKQEDYNEIFHSSGGSSIPILELSDTDDSIKSRSSEINYKDVFSGFSDDKQAIGVSYQDLMSANIRTQSASESPSKRPDYPTFPEENQLLSAEASSLAFDDKKHFNMSYHKTSAGSQDGSNGTIHVAQFHPEPGFTTFVDDSSPQESEANKPDSSVTSDICRKLDFSDRKPEDVYTKKAVQHIDTQRSGRREVISRTGFQQDGSISSDKLLNEDVDNLRPNLSKKRLPACVEKNNNDFTKRSTLSKSEAPEGDGSLSFFSEELDLNSAAAISAAALKDAIQKAQKIIEIAKKFMERKKGGLHSRSNKVFKDCLRVEVRKQNPGAHEEKRTDNINAKDTCDYVDSLLNAFSWRWKSAFRRGQDELYFRTSTLGKVTNAQNRATNEKLEPALSTVLNLGNYRAALPEQQVVMNKHEYDVGERNLTREALMKQEVSVEKDGENVKAHKSGFIKKKVHAVVMDNELESSVNKLAKDVDMENSLVSQEDGFCEKTEIEYKQKMEDEMKFKFVLLKNSDYDKSTCKTQQQDHNKPQVNFQQHSEKTTANIKEELEHRPRTICNEGLEERFEDALEWAQNEDEPDDSASNENEKDTHIAEVIWGGRRLAELNKLTAEEKKSTASKGHKEIEENNGTFELRGSRNGYGSCNQYEKTENKQTGTKKLEALQQSEYECTVNRESDPLSHDASENIIETQGACQPYTFDESSKAKQVNDNIRSIDTAAREFCDFREGEAEEAKVVYKVHKIEHFETVGLVQGATEENEDKKMRNVFEVVSSEGSIPGFGLTDSDLEHKEHKQRNKDFKPNINPDNGDQISVIVSAEKDNVFKEAEISRDEKAVKNSPDISNGERDVVISKNFEASPGSTLSSEIEKVIQVDEEMTERHNTHMSGDSYSKTIEEKEENTKPDKEMETEIVVELDVDNPKEEVRMKGTKTEKAVLEGVEGYEYLKRIHEESKRERQRERDRIAVEPAIQEARARAVAEARERAERAAVERAISEVRQRMMAEARGKLEKATTAAKPPPEKALVDAKLRSERAAVDRATAEARARALEKALSKKPTRNTATEDLRKSDKAYIESAQRSKARLEREERVMERAAKALAEKNMRDLLAQKEEAEKNRLAESLDAEIRRWSTGKEGNLRALLSTLQYILGPGSGWQPISLTDIITSNAVKKAYRKATLHVHPDKLQQRGASIREKYICEKVFDLLKVAWNRFSSEER